MQGGTTLYSKTISRRNLAMVAGLALVASLLLGLNTVSQAQEPCTVTGPAITESPADGGIEGGTRIAFKVECDTKPTPVDVALRVAAADLVVLVEKDNVTIGAMNASLDKTIDLKVPPVDIDVCIEVAGQQVESGEGCPE